MSNNRYPEGTNRPSGEPGATRSTDPRRLLKQLVPVSGGELYTEVAGQGLGLLLLQDHPADHRLWDEQFGLFAQRYKTVRIDTRGYGRSSRDKVPYTNNADYAVVLEEHQLKPASVIVQGDGAAVLRLVRAQPTSIRALVFVSAGFQRIDLSGPDSPEFLAAIQDVVEKYGPRADAIADAFRTGDVGKFIEILMADESYAPPSSKPRARRLVQQMMDENVSFHPLMPTPEWGPSQLEILPEIRVPTLVLVGDRVDEELQQSAIDLEAGIPNARRVVVPDAGAFVNLEQPELFTKLVLDFLAGVDATGQVGNGPNLLILSALARAISTERDDGSGIARD